MLETQDEIEAMQRLMDATLGRANAHMLDIVTPERRLSAAQVAAYLQGTRHVAFATVNSKAEPRVAPLDSLFIHGRFVMSTGGAASRVTNLRANPACSAAHIDGDRVAVVANGTVEWIGRGHADHAEIHSLWTATYGMDPYEMGEIAIFRLAPSSMWAFATHPEEFAAA